MATYLDEDLVRVFAADEDEDLDTEDGDTGDDEDLDEDLGDEEE